MDFEKIIAKLSTHLGHDDAAAVTDTDLVAWKESLIEANLNPKTIKNRLLVVKTLFKFAKANKKITNNVAAEVSYQARTDPREKRLGYSDEDAKRILIAARGETEPHLRWVPWLACFTGARLEELVGAMVRDVETIEGVPCLHIRLDYRPRQASLKKMRTRRARSRCIPRSSPRVFLITSRHFRAMAHSFRTWSPIALVSAPAQAQSGSVGGLGERWASPIPG